MWWRKKEEFQEVKDKFEVSFDGKKMIVEANSAESSMAAAIQISMEEGKGIPNSIETKIAAFNATPDYKELKSGKFEKNNYRR